MKVVALTKYDSLAASTRQRFLQYAPALRAAGIDLHLSPLFGNDYLSAVLGGGRGSKASILKGYARRLSAIVRSSDADVVWLHCEFLPYWPGFAEALATKLVGKPILFDFDDAIFHQYDDNPRFLARFLLSGKLEPLLKRVAAAACGNSYLRDYAGRFCDDSIVLPTIVDTDLYRPLPRGESDRVTIGWIGSPSTWPNVRPLLPLLRDLVDHHGVSVRVVGAGAAANEDRFPGLDLVDWSEEAEIELVQAMDIGIMPLVDRPFERGKCGYKLIQYMACGLPVVASPVGVNAMIVRDGDNGFLASSEEQWRSSLLRLIGDRALRAAFGAAGRRRVEEEFSLASQAPRLIALLRRAASRRAG